ncbi:hypothetical protein M413DRAFT_75596 [Hebeloma cylindrosporum]|uniref:DUF6533 domain-containing protein n=1 Tax=Hebeloma cylindrosporum TaxID=76867 RepID=A0A0C2XME3_HEBCY|nr:hypothetical protein M413DRAFT_75596 [Hebeloma cylindrosporum h7]
MQLCSCDFKKRYDYLLTAAGIYPGLCAFPFNIRRLVGLSPIFYESLSLFTSIALLWYDYAITWTREVQYFWTKRFTLSTALYILCRYGMVASVVYTLALAGKLPKMRVPVWGSRAYALFHRSKVILIIFGSLELVVLSFLTIINLAPTVPALLTIFTVTYEIISATLTSVRSLQALKGGGPWRWRAQQMSLTFLVLREGLCYYPLLNILSASLYSISPRQPGTFFPGLMNAYTLPLAGLMTARFLLNLREWDHRMTNPETEEWNAHGIGGYHHHSPMRFAKSECRATQWTINDVLREDPLLKGAEASEREISSGDASLSLQDSEKHV